MDIRVLLAHVGREVRRKTGQVPCLHQTLDSEPLVLLPPPVGWVPAKPEAEMLRCELADLRVAVGVALGEAGDRVMRSERAVKASGTTDATMPEVDARVSESPAVMGSR